MNVVFTKTGSKGNASVVSDSKTLIQIDAGIAPEKVNKGIDYRMNEIEGVIVTHEHLDLGAIQAL